MKLRLGVYDFPYVQWIAPQKGKGRRPKRGPPSGVTTAMVARWLEDKYHVMEVFYEENAEEIHARLLNSMKKALSSIAMGAPPMNPYGDAENWIKRQFKDFISLKEMDKLGYPGIPTKASLMGVNHRLGIKHGLPRPSFRDTGQYEAAFHAWMEK